MPRSWPESNTLPAEANRRHWDSTSGLGWALGALLLLTLLGMISLWAASVPTTTSTAASRDTDLDAQVLEITQIHLDSLAEARQLAFSCQPSDSSCGMRAMMGAHSSGNATRFAVGDLLGQSARRPARCRQALRQLHLTLAQASELIVSPNPNNNQVLHAAKRALDHEREVRRQAARATSLCPA